jgi:cytochrome c-type biogenesis protein CcmH
VRLRIALGFALFFIVVAGGMAQEETSDPVITDDDVNAIANDMYCPVCEGIPLADCGTDACNDWRYEIRLGLESGMTRDEIIDDFIDRFGESVVGSPQDPLLRALTLWLPRVLVVIGLFFGVRLLIQMTRSQPVVETDPARPKADQTNRYRDIFERDVSG